VVNALHREHINKSFEFSPQVKLSFFQHQFSRFNLYRIFIFTVRSAVFRMKFNNLEFLLLTNS
jgi:hypothetical protein